MITLVTFAFFFGLLIIRYIFLFFRLKSDQNKIKLFDGYDSLFKKVVTEAKVYGEYGCGNSTIWTLENTSANIISVDTSMEWIMKVKDMINKNCIRVNIHHTNLGEVGDWGRPISYVNQKNFNDYTNHIWEQAEKPSVVLIDGRFRVCCFLTTLKFAFEGTKILFDDYTDRPHYHYIEKYVSRKKECGRQCLFIVPSKRDINIKELNKDIDAFRYVMD